MESLFLELFSGKFREIWAKILRTPKHLLAPTPMQKRNEHRKEQETKSKST